MAGSWRLARSLEVLREQVNELYPGRDKASDGTIGDAAHAATVNDHNPDKNGVVAAIDITHDPEKGLDIEQLAASLMQSRDTRIKYIIFNHKIVVPSSVTGWSARAYNGGNPHITHMHLSVNAENYDVVSKWKLGGAMNPKPEEVSYVFDKVFGRPARQDELNTYITHGWPTLVKAVLESNESLIRKHKAVIDELERSRDKDLHPEIERLRASKADPDAIALKELIKKIVKE